MERKLFHFEKLGMGDNIQVVLEADSMRISIEEPWAGDTETGFGATAGITIPIDKAAELRDWLNKVLP